jgi:hypothetical protein
MVFRHLPVDHFHAANFNNSMASCWIHACGLSIQNDLAILLRHNSLSRNTLTKYSLTSTKARQHSLHYT